MSNPNQPSTQPATTTKGGGYASPQALAALKLTNAGVKQVEAMMASPISHMPVPHTPTAVEWTLTVNDLENEIRTLVSKFLGASEIRYVTVSASRKGSWPVVHVWLDKNSAHLVDQSNNRDRDILVETRIERFSKEIKDLCDAFAPTHRPDGTNINRKKMIQVVKPDSRSNPDLRAIVLDCKRLIERIFDSSNTSWRDTYPSAANCAPFTLECQIIMKGGRTDGLMSAIRIAKKSNANRRGNGKPVAAFSDSNRRRFDDESDD